MLNPSIWPTAPRSRRADFPGQIDQLLQDFDGADRVGVMAGNRRVQMLGELPALNDIALTARAHLIVQQLAPARTVLSSKQ
ncbi:hypothetical protein EDC35_10156 [Thiobaca trueperi]|uniref:Uncharacterized protein n=1 Tax=Thiobaca trueperi TaxID=127458 RepID=A0A4R3N4P5_9GAMM|nr:hypothetical protein EDC35_10156 [Thiobaca trueperi]